MSTSQGETVGSAKHWLGGWMSASPAAWVGLIVGLISIGSTGYQWVWTSAALSGQVASISRDLERNFREDEYNRERFIKAVERIDTTMTGMNKMEVKIGQLETQLTNITEILRDIRASGHIMPNHPRR